MRRYLAAAAGSGGVLVGLSTAGWLGVAFAFGTVVVMVAAITWVLSDARRTRRLVALIDAVRRRPADLGREPQPRRRPRR